MFALLIRKLLIGQVLGEIESKQLGQGFRTPGLIRFVSQDTGYLSPTSDGPRMFVNLEDYLSRTTGTTNTQFQVTASSIRTPSQMQSIIVLDACCQMCTSQCIEYAQVLPHHQGLLCSMHMEVQRDIIATGWSGSTASVERWPQILSFTHFNISSVLLA